MARYSRRSVVDEFVGRAAARSIRNSAAHEAAHEARLAVLHGVLHWVRSTAKKADESARYDVARWVPGLRRVERHLLAQIRGSKRVRAFELGECLECCGLGAVVRRVRTSAGAVEAARVTCPACNGNRPLVVGRPGDLVDRGPRG